MSHRVEKVLPAPKRTIEWTRTKWASFWWVPHCFVHILYFLFCTLCFCPSHLFCLFCLVALCWAYRVKKGNAKDKALTPLHTTTVFTCSLKTKSRYKEHSTKSYLKPWPESLQRIHIGMSCSIWLMHLNT